MKTALSNLGQMLGVTKTNLISDNNGTSRVLIITLYRTLIGAGQRGSAPPNLTYTANVFYSAAVALQFCTACVRTTQDRG